MTSDKTVSDKPVNGVRRSVEYISRRPEIAAMARNLPGLIEAYKEVAANGNSGSSDKKDK